jgi:hypothetical protein
MLCAVRRDQRQNHALFGYRFSQSESEQRGQGESELRETGERESEQRKSEQGESEQRERERERERGRDKSFDIHENTELVDGIGFEWRICYIRST